MCFVLFDNVEVMGSLLTENRLLKIGSRNSQQPKNQREHNNHVECAYKPTIMHRKTRIQVSTSSRLQPKTVHCYLGVECVFFMLFVQRKTYHQHNNQDETSNFNERFNVCGF